MITLLIYIIVFLVTSILLSYSFNNNSLIKNDIRKGYIIVSFVILWFIIGMQNNVGTDYPSYIKIYNEIDSLGVVLALSTLITEPLYVILNFITNVISEDPQSIFITSSFIALLFIYLSILKEKQFLNLGIALLIFLVTYYLSFFNVVRLSIAVSIVIYSYRFLINKQVFRYLVGVMVATGFHYTAIIMLPVYFIISWRYYSKIFIGISFILFLVTITFYDKIFITVFEGTKYIGYIDELGNFEGGLNQIILHLPLFLLVVFYQERLIKYNNNNRTYLLLFYLGSLLLLVTLVLGIIDRLAVYFLASQIFLIPQLIRVLKTNEKVLIAYCIILYYSFKFVLFLISNPRYLDYSNVILENLI